MKETMIRESLDASLSGVFVTEQRHRDMLNSITGGQSVKRKMTVGLVLVLALLTLSVTAVAAAIMNRVFEQVIDMEVEHGPFITWGHEERFRLLKLLDENGWAFPEDELRQAYRASDPEEQAALVTRLITDAFGREDALSHFSVIERVKGPMTTWSLEDKAWYTDYIRSRINVLDTWRDVLPEEGDLSREDAVRIARETILSAFNLEESALDGMIADVSFFTTEGHDAPRWKIDFQSNPYANAEYTVLLTREGEVTEDASLEIDTPEHEAEKRETVSTAPIDHAKTWSLEKKAAFYGSENGVPTAQDISEEQALLTAMEAMTGMGLNPTQYTPDMWYKRYDPDADARQKPFYCIYFVDNPDAPCDVWCVFIDAHDGTVLETVHASENSNG